MLEHLFSPRSDEANPCSIPSESKHYGEEFAFYPDKQDSCNRRMNSLVRKLLLILGSESNTMDGTQEVKQLSYRHRESKVATSSVIRPSFEPQPNISRSCVFTSRR